MNDINAAQREREATVSRAETNKLLLVKQAEAEAESKRLQGEGIANQRKAIIAGLKDSVEDFAKTVPGSTPQDVMQLVLMTQYFDTLKEIAANDHTQHAFDSAHAKHAHRSVRPDPHRNRHRCGDDQAPSGFSNGAVGNATVKIRAGQSGGSDFHGNFGASRNT